MSGAPEYTLIRCARKTLSLSVNRELQAVVRAPYGLPLPDIERFVLRHAGWIEKHRGMIRRSALLRPEPDESERRELIAKARAVIPAKVTRYSEIMGLSPSGIRITSARSRFGSCSSKNRLCFSWRLMLYPDKAIDYVVAHELAHIAHKNHGPGFYALLASVMPDHRERRLLLRD